MTKAMAAVVMLKKRLPNSFTDAILTVAEKIIKLHVITVFLKICICVLLNWCRLTETLRSCCLFVFWDYALTSRDGYL